MTEKRGLILLLVVATVAIFVGLVWAIATFLPLNSSTTPNPTSAPGVSQTSRNCAASLSYWKEHPEYYPTQMFIGNQPYTAADINAIFTVQSDDLSTQLKAQLTAAYLNILSGADQSYIEATIFEAYSWLVQHPTETQISDSDRNEGIKLFNLLEAYNQGLTGVPPCENSSSAPTAVYTSSITTTITATVIPNPSDTTAISENPEPTSSATNVPIYTFVVPSKTPFPTTPAPVHSTSTAIRTREPTATNTPKPPTPVSPTPIPPTPITPTLPPTDIPTQTLPPP